jgi:hypothetical protein
MNILGKVVNIIRMGLAMCILIASALGAVLLTIIYRFGGKK